jgi:hypothetical protein
MALALAAPRVWDASFMPSERVSQMARLTGKLYKAAFRLADAYRLYTTSRKEA